MQNESILNLARVFCGGIDKLEEQHNDPDLTEDEKENADEMSVRLFGVRDALNHLYKDIKWFEKSKVPMIEEEKARRFNHIINTFLADVLYPW